MSHSLASRQYLSKLVLEGVVVVASILIAFALDAWWAERQLRSEIRGDLSILEHELAENEQLARFQIDMMEQIVAANNSLVADLAAREEAVTVPVADTLFFWSIFINPTLDPSLGGIDAWIAAGRMSGVDQPMLRQRLASIRGMVEDVVEEQRVARDISTFAIYPLIGDGAGDIALVQALFASGYHMRVRTAIELQPESGTIDVRNSSALRFLLRSRTIWYEASILEMQGFLVEIREIRELIVENIERMGG